MPSGVSQSRPGTPEPFQLVGNSYETQAVPLNTSLSIWRCQMTALKSKLVSIPSIIVRCNGEMIVKKILKFISYTHNSITPINSTKYHRCSTCFGPVRLGHWSTIEKSQLKNWRLRVTVVGYGDQKAMGSADLTSLYFEERVLYRQVYHASGFTTLFVYHRL